MLERDHIGMTPDTLTRPLPGGVAAQRHALARQRYGEEKRLRLAAEADARRYGWVQSWRIAGPLRALMARLVPSGGRRGAPPDAARK